MDEAHLLAALRHVRLNPARARLVAQAEDRAWSSDRTPLGHGDDGLAETAPFAARVPDFAALPERDPDDPAYVVAFRRADAIGRPLGSVACATDLAARLGRPVRARKRGRRPKQDNGI